MNSFIGPKGDRHLLMIDCLFSGVGQATLPTSQSSLSLGRGDAERGARVGGGAGLPCAQSWEWASDGFSQAGRFSGICQSAQRGGTGNFARPQNSQSRFDEKI